jgi:hypothetical protein
MNPTKGDQPLLFNADWSGLFRSFPFHGHEQTDLFTMEGKFEDGFVFRARLAMYFAALMYQLMSLLCRR